MNSLIRDILHGIGLAVIILAAVLIVDKWERAAREQARRITVMRPEVWTARPAVVDIKDIPRSAIVTGPYLEGMTYSVTTTTGKVVHVDPRVFQAWGVRSHE